MAEMIYAGEFATESENRAAAILSKLPNDWIVICNKMLPTHGRTSEIDFIIIGQRLVFLLDEKSWSDPIDIIMVRGILEQRFLALLIHTIERWT